jgi:serine/threonine-protein kinase
MGGGMSDVWLARHVLLASPLVVKTPKPHLPQHHAA